MRRLVASACLALTVVVVACGGGDDPTAPSSANQPAVTGTTPPPNLATASNGNGLSITTDKDDYQPGDTVWFTGAGWQPGDTLDIVLADEPLTHEPHTWSVAVDETGGFTDSTYVVDVGDLGVTFTLTATSRATPAQALTVQFTDGNPGVPVVSVPQSPNPVTPGSTATYVIQINYSGTNALCTVALSAAPTATPAWPAAPPGGFFNFSPASVTGRGTGGGGTAVNPQSTLTVTVPAGTLPNTYRFVITRTLAQQTGETCQGTATQTLTVNLVVAAATTTAITSSQNPSVVGSAVTFTATVTTGSPAVAVTSGQVSFKTGGTTCADATPAQAAQNFVGGQVTYTPSPNLTTGAHVIRACYEGATGLAPSEASLTQQVNAITNAAPVLGAVGDQSVNEQTLLTFTATATDNPAQTLTFSLSNGAAGSVPSGAAIVPGTGVFTWTPTEVQGPGTYTFDVCVADNGTPSLSDCETITVTVNEVNKAPVLANIAAQQVDEETELGFTATATDEDVLAGGATNTLTFSLVAGTDPVPAGASITAGGAFTWTPTEAQGPGVYKFKVQVTDDGTPNLSDDQEITITVREVNRAPELGTIGPKSVNEGSPLTFTATASDPDLPANTLTFSLQTGGNADLATASIGSMSGAFSWTPADDNPTSTPSDNYTVAVVVTDNGVNPDNLSASENVTITVNNVAPTITDVALTPASLGNIYPILGLPSATATFTDPGTTDTHTCRVQSYDYLNVAQGAPVACGSVLPAASIPEAGVYNLAVTVTDDDGGASAPYVVQIVVYDPSAGFVTGGGWINSPAGAYAYDQNASGKATFGFVSKYQKGATAPTGNTEFVFHAGSLNFKSSSYEWLVVNAVGTRAQYKGAGTIDGRVGTFKFILTAIDGKSGPDSFRMQIFMADGTTALYDNQVEQQLGGGSIVIHTGKK
jgi:hypothetical protein